MLDQPDDKYLFPLLLQGVALAYSSELGEKGDDCKPGTPFSVFRTEPSVALQAINTQAFTGLFETTLPILQVGLQLVVNSVVWPASGSSYAL